ncbi:DNA repair protein RecO [Persicimonas caeni]|uniref:DNA repair protein RecO n=1 Tax=Persicimonas caeni TaxID=2292766 RepID=A0A4Y6PXJ8_PERCE|nr:DNA repair protein RecO [Persicimonas caeni]QDG52960.1 DNA repair protein RecO [Persicimonas caeni]QED34182.1 DNA repair protein RecO [Persicimonas caeni]
MSEPRQTRAFVLRKVNYGENDLIVTLLGRDTGKFSAIARGARASRKRFGGGLQPMRCLDLSYTQKSSGNLAFLREIDVVEDFPALEGDFDRITIASYATELVREVSQEANPDVATFELLRAFYRQLCDSDDSTLALQAVLHHFELNLLELQGTLPSLDGCFRCGAPADTMDKIRCIRTGEGLVCNACRRPGEGVGVIQPATLELLHYFHTPGPQAPRGLSEPAVVNQARRVVDASFEQMLDKPLKSRVMLETVLEDAFA